MPEEYKKEMIQLAEGVGKHRMKCIAMWAGKDLSVLIVGGDVPHIGSVAMAVPRPSLRDSKDISSTASVLTAVGHKDDEVARAFSLHLAKELSTIVVVTAGIHIDGADEDDIKKILVNSDKLMKDLVAILNKKESNRI